MSRFLFHVENFFFFMSRIFFLSWDFDVMSRVFPVEMFQFKSRILFYLKSRFLFTSRSLNCTFFKSRRDVTQEYLLAFPGKDKSNKITWRSVY